MSNGRDLSLYRLVARTSKRNTKNRAQVNDCDYLCHVNR